MSPLKRVAVRRWTIVATLAAMVALPAGAWVMASGTRENHDLLQAIQRERARNVRTNCEEQNRRHDATIRQLHRLVDELPPGPRKVRAVQGMAGSVALIQALAPKRDCRALVAQQVNTN
jgi:cell division protein FtsB